ncbi:MAG TPA: CocE/NonD family hydrolase [Xanthobacteraceae bacterium]|nr:CocE/NonD family hydrolase [Xanthobacteraceae bacterium]
MSIAEAKHETHDPLMKSEVRDGMRIDWDVPIPMDDGIVLRADVFRPIVDGRYPVIMNHVPYGKGLSFQEGFKSAWDRMVEAHPDVPANSTNQYQNWEAVDPEKWVPEGYACVRVDSRGSGRSPGYLDVWSPRETKDFYDCIEWAAAQPWSNGKIGLNGISYYAMNQWQVATWQPPHLAAMCVWEGAADFYRDVYRHGGIVNMMPLRWYPRQVRSVQHGVGERGRRSVVTGELVAGPETLPEAELKKNCTDLEADVLSHPLDDDFYTSRSPQWEKVVTPFLSANNWGGQGLHPRGNNEGFLRAASKQKWLECHGLGHWPHFYTDYGRELQKRFFDYFLKGEQNGWDKQPKVQLNIRYPGEKFVIRHENEWPLARTQWTKFYLHPTGLSLDREPSSEEASLSYETTGAGLTFITPPLVEETEITGHLAAKLFVSSETSDADLFVTVRVLDPAYREVTFMGALDPRTPIANGWLRASQRKLDPELSLPYRPYHAHDEKQPLGPGEIYQLDIEIWPTCIVVPPGYRIALTVMGRDFEHAGPPITIPHAFYNFTGVGPFFHNHPKDRPAEVFDTRNTLHFGPQHQPYLMLPIIPAK